MLPMFLFFISQNSFGCWWAHPTYIRSVFSRTVRGASFRRSRMVAVTSVSATLTVNKQYISKRLALCWRAMFTGDALDARECRPWTRMIYNCTHLMGHVDGRWILPVHTRVYQRWTWVTYFFTQPNPTQSIIPAHQGLNCGGSRRISDPAPLIWDPLPLMTDPVPHNWDPAPFCWDPPLCWVESKHQALFKCGKSQT